MQTAPGFRFCEFKVTPTRTQLFMFSAITWNRHKIHFDKNQAQHEGFPDVVVQRGLIGNFLVQCVNQWAIPGARIKNLKWKVLRSAFPEQELRCFGEVISETEFTDQKEISCFLEIGNEFGDQIAIGEVTLQLKVI